MPADPSGFRSPERFNETPEEPSVTIRTFLVRRVSRISLIGRLAPFRDTGIRHPKVPFAWEREWARRFSGSRFLRWARMAQRFPLRHGRAGQNTSQIPVSEKPPQHCSVTLLLFGSAL
jgi:hypothetical protein